MIDLSKVDVNFSMNNFMTKINKILDTHMPLRKITQKEFKQKFKPWISYIILNKIRDKNKIFNKYMSCKNEARKAELYSNFKILKNEITRDTRTSKKAYYQKYFNEHKGNLQKNWKGIK